MAVTKVPATRVGGYWRILRGMLGSCLAVGCLNGFPANAQENVSNQWSLTNTNVSLEASTAARQTVQMVINTSREITAKTPFKRVRIQNPNVISALPLEGGNRLQISAMGTGVTQVDLLGADGSNHSIEVMVLGDVRELEAILRQEFPDANLRVVPVQQGCIVSGFVTSDEHVNHVMQIAELYFPTIINKVSVTGIHTIQLETQIMEVSRTKLRELGVDWAFGNGDDYINQSVSGLLTTTAAGIVGKTGSDTLSFGVVENSSSFFSALSALRRNNLVKVLASPTLTAVDGRPASFNAGGEIPIIVPAGLGQVAIQFREFGTRLDYVAKVKGNGRIWLEVRPYVSEIDPSRAIQIDGISVPGLRSRFLETGVELGAGQTLALAGLLQVKSETINTGLPLLADLPYIGAIFRSTREEQNEIELLITVTPNFAGPLDPHEVPQNAPGTSTQSPTDKELFWRGYVESPVDASCPPGGSAAPDMINYAPYDMQAPAGMIPAQPTFGPSGAYGSGGYGNGYGGGVSEPANYPTSGSLLPPPTPVPNSAAMSVGPNPPNLAQQPRAGSQSNLYYPQTASGQQPVFGPTSISDSAPSGPIMR